MTAPIRLLVVDDEPLFVKTIARVLSRKGMEVATAEGGAAARERLGEETYDVVLCDLVMPGVGGLEVLKASRERQPGAAFILLTAHATIDIAVEALKCGADDFLQKPAEIPDVERAIRKGYEAVRLRRENADLRQRLGRTEAVQELLGESPGMARVRELVDRVAPTDATVLILGESGVGKELVARRVHRRSERCDAPFLTLNCGALQANVLANELFGHVAGAFTGATKGASGLFEAAHGGTLFVDEIGEMDLEIQKTFLRVIESGEYRRMGEVRTRKANVRIVAATNRDLAGDVDAGRFRRDLYYRLNVFELTVPPLRERPEDLPALVAHLVRRMEPRRRPPRTLAPEAMRALAAHAWPGNVRELRNAIERGLIMADGDVVTLADLPPLRGPTAARRPAATAAPSAPPSASEVVAAPGAADFPRLQALEKAHVERALALSDGNKTRASRLLGISLRSLYTKLDRHGLREA